jgi:hypothetical protein
LVLVLMGKSSQPIPSHPMPSYPILSMIMLDGNMITWELTIYLLIWFFEVGWWRLGFKSFCKWVWVCVQSSPTDWNPIIFIHTYIHTYIHTLVAVCGDWLPLLALWQIKLT